MKTMKFFNNDEGVSPIVATLVLIVVAIIGAAAVGLILSSFSSSVSTTANSGYAAAGASGQLTIAGSSSMYPTIQVLGTYYSNNNSGIKVSVSAGGSGVGYMSVEKDMADIGMISEPINSSQLLAYPNLKYYQVGASAVAFATGSTTTGSNPVAPTVVSLTDLQALYSGTTPSAYGFYYYNNTTANFTLVKNYMVSLGVNKTATMNNPYNLSSIINDSTNAALNGASVPTSNNGCGNWSYINNSTAINASVLAKGVVDSNGNMWTVVEDRSDVSGTSDTAFTYLFGTTSPSLAPYIVGQNGNGDMIKALYVSNSLLGYVDADYAYTYASTYPVSVLSIQDSSYTGSVSVNGQPGYAASSSNMMNEITKYPSSPIWPVKLCRPLNLITNGPASSMAANFITYCQGGSDAITGAFKADNQVHVTKIYTGSPFIE